MRRVISLLLTIVMLCAMAVPALAAVKEEATVSPRYTYITANFVDFYINESTNVSTSDAYVVTYDDYEVQIVCKLQRYNNSKWNTVKTWTESGIGYVGVLEDWAVPSGYTYRAHATFYVYDNNGNVIETATNSCSYYFPKP